MGSLWAGEEPKFVRELALSWRADEAETWARETEVETDRPGHDEKEAAERIYQSRCES